MSNFYNQDLSFFLVVCVLVPTNFCLRFPIPFPPLFLYGNVKKLKEENTIVVSIDEKTGMQATQRIAQDKPVKKGSVAKLEFEYKCHGTQCFI